MKKHISDILYVIGAAAICFGVAMLSIPVATILAGIFCILISYFIYRDSTKKGAK